MTIVAKTVGEPLTWQSTFRDIVKRVDPDLPVAQVRSMETVIQRSVDWRETPMRLLTGFSIIGLLLASIGVYGVLAYYVSQRTREIGVRAALGATGRQLATLVVRQSMLPILAGVIAGVAGSFDVGPPAAAVPVSGAARRSASDRRDRGVADWGRIAGELDAGRRAAAIDPMAALRDE